MIEQFIPLLRRDHSRAVRRQAATMLQEQANQIAELTGVVEQLTKALDWQKDHLCTALALLQTAAKVGTAPDAEQVESLAKAVHGGSAHTSTNEQLLSLLYMRIGAAAGVPAGAPFNPLNMLDMIRVTLSAQANNAKYLEWTLSRLWHEGDGFPPTLVTAPAMAHGDASVVQVFDSGTTWMEALDTVMAREAASAADQEPAEETSAEPAAADQPEAVPA